MKILPFIVIVILLSQTAFSQDSTKINKQTFPKLPAVMEFKGNKGETFSTNVVMKCKDCPPPLYIVDGVENPSDNIKNLDPKNIESINIIKGTKAIAEYGEKGRNGVVLVTSKKK
jgi:TonB-dependent SusC/RagA subfamily outer membrane receptor